MLLSIDAASVISTMKVDSPSEMLSEAPTRVNILSTTPMRALSAATKQPVWASSTLMAVWRSSADLPDMLGPVMIMTCVESFERLTELAIYFSPGGS